MIVVSAYKMIKFSCLFISSLDSQQVFSLSVAYQIYTIYRLFDMVQGTFFLDKKVSI